MSNVTYKLFADKMGGTNVASYIGNAGDIFYNPAHGALSISDGVTEGGIPIDIHSGNLIYDHDIIPVADNTYSLGSDELRWKEIHIGPGTLYIQDQNNAGLNCALTVLDGVLQIDGANQLQVGQLKFIDNTIESATPDIDISIGLTSSTGLLLLNRATTFENSKEVRLGNLQVLDGNENVVAQLKNIDGVGKLVFGGGSTGLSMDGGKTMMDIGYSSITSNLQQLHYNTSTKEISYAPQSTTSIRTLSGVTTAFTIDFSTDTFIHLHTNAATVTATLTNFTAGKIVDVLVYNNIGGTQQYNHGATSSNAVGGQSFFLCTHPTMWVKYVCIDNTSGNCFVKVNV